MRRLKKLSVSRQWLTSCILLKTRESYVWTHIACSTWSKYCRIANCAVYGMYVMHLLECGSGLGVLVLQEVSYLGLGLISVVVTVMWPPDAEGSSTYIE